MPVVSGLGVVLLVGTGTAADDGDDDPAAALPMMIP